MSSILSLCYATKQSGLRCGWLIYRGFCTYFNFVAHNVSVISLMRMKVICKQATKIECWCHVGAPWGHQNVRTQKCWIRVGHVFWLKAHPHIQLRGGHRDHALSMYVILRSYLDLIWELLETQSHHSPILVCPTIWTIEGFQFSEQLLCFHLHISFIKRWKLWRPLCTRAWGPSARDIQTMRLVKKQGMVHFALSQDLEGTRDQINSNG